MISPMSTRHITKEAEKMMIGLLYILPQGGINLKVFLCAAY